MNFLEKLTGIPGLISDPHLRGGSLHEIRREGALGVHADFNLYPGLNIWRRLNFLLYLNEPWDASWGGELELWDRSGKQKVKGFQPVFNRVVILPRTTGRRNEAVTSTRGDLSACGTSGSRVRNSRDVDRPNSHGFSTARLLISR